LGSRNYLIRITKKEQFANCVCTCNLISQFQNHTAPKFSSFPDYCTMLWPRVDDVLEVFDSAASSRSEQSATHLITSGKRTYPLAYSEPMGFPVSGEINDEAKYFQRGYRTSSRSKRR
jgi:hypothetical protein